MRPTRLSILATAALLLPAVASAWTAWNRLEVQPLKNGVYEVISDVGSGPVQFWCGAGDYGMRVLGAGATQRIYIWEAIGPSVTRPGRKAVQFSLTPPPGADTSTGYSLTVKRAGDNITAAMAQNYCYDRLAGEPQVLRP